MNVPKCSLCKNAYDHATHRPLILPDCSHTFCQQCLDRQLKSSPTGRLMCPVDETVRSTAGQSHRVHRPAPPQRLHHQDADQGRPARVSGALPRVRVLLPQRPRELTRPKSVRYAGCSDNTKATKSCRSGSCGKWRRSWRRKCEAKRSRSASTKTTAAPKTSRTF